MRCCEVSSKEKGWWETGLEQGRKEEFREICTGLCWSRKSPQTPPNLNCPVSSQKLKDVLRCPTGRCNCDIYQPPISDPQEGAPNSIFTCTTEKSSYRLQVKLKHLNEVRRESNQSRRGQNDPNKWKDQAVDLCLSHLQPSCTLLHHTHAEQSTYKPRNCTSLRSVNIIRLSGICN